LLDEENGHDPSLKDEASLYKLPICIFEKLFLGGFLNKKYD